MDNQTTTNTRTETNRQNGLLGGVKTPEGKEITRYNSVKHGVLKQIISDYEKPLYSHLLEELNEEHCPVGLMEQLQVERLAVWYIRLFRSARAEGEQMRSILSPSEHLRLMTKAYEPTVRDRDIETLGKTYARYDAFFENRIFKILHELERLQRLRAGEEIPVPVPVDVNFGSFGKNDYDP